MPLGEGGGNGDDYLGTSGQKSVAHVSTIRSVASLAKLLKFLNPPS